MSNKPINFRPSPQLRSLIENSDSSPTTLINTMFDHIKALTDLDSIYLTSEEQELVKEHLQGVFIDQTAIEAIAVDIKEMGNKGLSVKFDGVGYGQILATLLHYKIISL